MITIGPPDREPEATVMALDFVHQDGIWNSNTGAVRFFAVDGPTSVMFTVSLEALEDLERVENLIGELMILAAYERHRDRIRTAARKLYASRPSSQGAAYVLTSAHFG